MEAELAIRLGDATLSMELRQWVNDAGMALFFFVIGLEVRREVSVGELRGPRRATMVAGPAGSTSTSRANDTETLAAARLGSDTRAR